LIGDSENVRNTIFDIVEDGGVVLTRAWAKAFAYMRGIDKTQAKLLTAIYNSYNQSPIDIRAEIVEMNNVTWVRAFRFILRLYEAHIKGSFASALNALKLYADIDRRKLSLPTVRQIISIAKETFSTLSDSSSTVEVVSSFNMKLSEKYSELKSSLLGDEFNVAVFDEYDLTSNTKKSKDFIANLTALTWETSYKLFTEVFSPQSKYMTVHQAKGLEWDKVIVSVTPNKFDKIILPAVYSNPLIKAEDAENEFVRMYYVACSRAREELYVHLPAGFEKNLLYTALEGKNIIYEITV
jgi:hypothetical protein